MSDDDRGFEDYESGPFCRHWGDPSDCEEVCAHCGHGCTDHSVGDDTSCEECGCMEWVEDRQ